MQLLDLIQNYQELLDEKETLEAKTRENHSAINAAKEAIAQQMIDDDCARISYNGYSYSLAEKTAYSKRSEAELAANGLDFFRVLREEGLGDLIRETVNPRTLQAAIRNYVEENGALSDGLATVIQSYEFTDITRRKDANKLGR